jgi:electron transfer flavoprotein beta subunit
MNIYVCIKQVPDTSLPVKIDAAGTGIDLTDMKFIINPYDEYAIEESLKIKERLGRGTVTLVTVGGERCQATLRSGLAMGCDEAVQLTDPLFEGSDPLTIARILAAFFKTQSADLIWTGKQAVDDDCAVVAQAMAEYLDLPHVCEVKQLELADDLKSATVHREIEGGAEVLTCHLPAVLSAQKGLNTPRYASLKGIMTSKKKTLRVLRAIDLGLGAATVGPQARKVKLRQLAYPESKRGGLRMLEGDLQAQVASAVKILHEELKII